MDFERAMEMMDSLNSDNEMSITDVAGYAEEIAQALYEYIVNFPVDLEMEDKDFKEQNNYREVAERLWCIIDDIDTYSDMIKPCDESSYKLFYEKVMIKQKERHSYLKSDGYKLYTCDKWEHE